MRPRRFFTNKDIALMKKWAAEGRPQSWVAAQMGRDPGVVAGAAKRYNIEYSPKPGASDGD